MFLIIDGGGHLLTRGVRVELVERGLWGVITWLDPDDDLVGWVASDGAVHASHPADLRVERASS